MVLSNKKLKQKLREAKGESLAANEFSQIDLKGKLSSGVTPEGNSRLQELFEASKQKGKLAKREKRRRSLPVRELGLENNSINGDNKDEDSSLDKEEVVASESDNGEKSEKKKKKKERKRRREEGESEEKGLVEDGIANEAKKAKKPRKKKKKKKKASKAVEKVNVEAEVEAEAVTHETEPIISQSLTNEDAATKIYVGGIPYYSTEDDIRSFFEGCGTITEIDCKKFPDSGKFRGIAIINFKTDAAAKRGLALDGSDMGGFFLKVQPYKTRANKVSDFAPKIVEGYNRTYVGNLSWDITEDDLKYFFSDCKIASIRLGIDKDTGAFRGYGHVDFSDQPSLLIALKLDQQIVCGRPIKISCAVPKGTKTHATAAPTATIDEAESDGLDTNAPVPAPTATGTENEAENGGSSAISGKIRRRTCYECGEKGHISSLCPKKQSAETSSAANEAESDGLDTNAPVPAPAPAPVAVPTGTEKEAENGGSSAISGKIRRRTCYECGEKGHISSLCPKKQSAETSYAAS